VPGLRVLLVVANGGPGGMQVQVALLARGLRESGCDVTVATGPGDLDASGAAVEPLSALTARSAPRVARELRAIVRRTAPDVVHGHGLRLAPLLALAARHRALVTCHGIDPRRARRAARLVRASGVPVAACGEGPRRLLAAHGVRSRVLDNAVPAMPPGLARAELASRFGFAAHAVVAVSPARLTEQKDPLTLVRALARAEALSCLLLGDGPLAPAVRGEVDRLGLAGRVVVAGWQPDGRALLAGADLLALASRWEGQPTVVLEAMAASVAVVATSCPGTADTVVDGISGLLAPVGDPDALGAALARASSDAPLRERLAEGARQQVGRHALSCVVAEHLDAYARVQARSWP